MLSRLLSNILRLTYRFRFMKKQLLDLSPLERSFLFALGKDREGWLK